MRGILIGGDRDGHTFTLPDDEDVPDRVIVHLPTGRLDADVHVPLDGTDVQAVRTQVYARFPVAGTPLPSTVYVYVPEEYAPLRRVQ